MVFRVTLALICGLVGLFSPVADLQAQSINPRLRGMVGSSYLSPADLEVLAGWKANLYSVQLISFGTVDTAGREEYLAELNSAMDRLDLLLAECSRLGLRVLVNLYYPPGGFSVRGKKPSHRIFTDAWAQQAIIDAWDILAARYKDNTTIWGFQLVNEPAFSTKTEGLKNWNELAQTISENIRRVDSIHKIVVNPPFGDPAKLKTMGLISGVSGIVYAVNMYYPFSFSHQRVDPRFKPQSYPSKSFRKTLMERYFQQVQKFQKRAKTPIHIHEISVARWAPNGSGARWLKDAFSIFEKNKWTWAYHAFREASPWNVELTNTYGVEVTATSPTDRLKAIKAVFKKNR